MRLALIALLLPAPAFAAGFEVLEHGAAATGMVGAFTGKADDVSAIFFNPAGLADQKGLQIYIGSTIVTGAPSASADGMNEIAAHVSPQPLPTMYASYQLKDDLTVGLGAFTQFGLAIQWPSDWAGRFLVTKASLRTITIDPTVAWRPKKWISIGGGIDVTPASVEIDRTLDLVAAEGTAHFAANTVGVGINLGVMLNLIPDTTIGLAYRSGYNLNFDSGALQLNVPPELQGQLSDMKASTKLPMPDLLSLGATYKPESDVTLIGQVDWTNWSRFQTLALNTPNPAMNMAIPQNWHDGWTLRAGAEWAYTTVDKVRAGLGFDWNPVPSSTLSPLLPDSNRVLASIGGSHDFGSGFTGELALMGVFFLDRKSTLPGFGETYSNTALLTSLSVSYHWGR